MHNARAASGPNRLPVLAPPRNIAVVRMDHLGDHVLGTGVLRALRTQYPGTRLVVVVPADVAGLYEPCPLLDEVVAVPDYTVFNNQEMLRYLQQLASRERFDMVMQPRFCEDYQGAGPFCKALAAPGARIIGFRQSWFPDPDYDPNPLFTDLIDAPDSLHAAQYAGLIVSATTGARVSAPPELWFSGSDWAHVADRWGLEPEQFVVVGIGASAVMKRPPLSTYAALLSHLLSTTYRIVLVGSGREVDFADAVSGAVADRSSGRIISTAGQLRLPELAALLSESRLYVGPDSGPKHMAAAVGRPVVEICWVPADFPAVSRGPNSAGQCWRPWNTPFEMVHPDAPTFLNAWQQPSYLQEPIPGISADALNSAVDRILGKGIANPPSRQNIQEEISIQHRDQ
jgi:ADP-heptose:LPS heptosyltransferase